MESDRTSRPGSQVSPGLWIAFTQTSIKRLPCVPDAVYVLGVIGEGMAGTPGWRGSQI